MGRTLLLIALTALVSACGEAAGGFVSEPTHPDLACNACHRGPTADRQVASVPASTCTASQCHQNGGPLEVTMGTVTWRHRAHGDTTVMSPDCSGCHVHETGSGPLVATTSACSFCHAEEISGSAAGDCRSCHQGMEQEVMASQGVTIDHASIPWIETGCIRCHYDVADPTVEVHLSECAGCHRDVTRVAEAGMGTNLHENHGTVGCTSCHADSPHQVQAMSSAVELNCADCHALTPGLDQAHLEEEPGWEDWAGCGGCHEDSHSGQQAMVLGVGPHVGIQPDFKFLQGMTCRSCHVQDDSTPRQTAAGVNGSLNSCASCHPAAYGQIPGWWDTGARQRLDRARAYLDAVERQAGADVTAEAREVVEFVAQGGVVHNVSLLDSGLREAMAMAASAATAAGVNPPSQPDFGRRARPGLCAHCHFEIGSTWVTRDMPEDFHREVMDRRAGVGQR
jgi:hypothetical protein